MEAVILAGGRGTRLQQLVPDLPKPMAPVAGRPFLEILLTMLSRKGFDRIVLSLGYLAEKVVGHFGTQYADSELVFEIEEKPLGTGGAARKALRRCITDHTFVLNGDTYLDLEGAEIEGRWQAHRQPLIVGCEVSDTSRYGRLYPLDSGISHVSTAGHSGPGLINAGCYVLPTQILEESPCGEVFSLETDWLPHALAQERFELFVSHGIFIDIGVAEDYQRAQEVLLGIND